jgi:antitoxin (DNA-binding transcriptional repressor) of toxin-antitoxin stability system
VIVTERGKVIAQLGPASQSVEERIWAMVDAGLADWNGKKTKTVQAENCQPYGQIDVRNHR